MKRGFAPWLLLILGALGITIGSVALAKGGWKSLLGNFTTGAGPTFAGPKGYGQGQMLQYHKATQTQYYNRTQQWTICACNKYTGVCRLFSENALSNEQFTENWEIVDMSKCEGYSLPGRGRWR